MALKIFIPTIARVDKQQTLRRLPEALFDDTYLVCPPGELVAHEDKGRNVISCPYKGIAQTRDYILDWATKEDIKYIVMLDDDVVLQRRRPDFRITNVVDENEYYEAFAWIENTLKNVAHCGWGTRFLAYANKNEIMSPARMMYCLAYDVEKVNRVKARFSKNLPWDSTMEDFHMTLQLLEAGLTNCISLEWRASPGASNAPGGCSTWRTTKAQTESAFRLADLHPNLVTVRPKKHWEGMDDGMYDVRVKWKQAIAGLHPPIP